MENLQFVPSAFIDNLVHMGVGLLGVFMIIGIIMASTYLIGYFTAKISAAKNNNND